MAYFLLFVVVALGAGGYYEYENLQASIVDQQRQVIELKSAMDQAVAKEKNLQSESDDLHSQMGSLRMTLADLKQPATGQTAVKPATEVTPTAPVAPPKPVILSNQLGTIVDLAGKTHTDCKLLRVVDDGIVVSDSDGISKLTFALLPKELQTRFGYDSAHGSLTDDQVQALEQLRLSADSANP